MFNGGDSIVLKPAKDVEFCDVEYSIRNREVIFSFLLLVKIIS